MGFTEISVTEANHPYVGPWWPHGHNLGWEHCQIIEKFHFLEAVANNRPMNPYNATFEDGYRVAVMIDAMRASRAAPARVEVEYRGDLGISGFRDFGIQSGRASFRTY